MASNKNNLVTIILGFVLLLPFVILSCYNHPLGDDYWLTGLVRNRGFVNAQQIIYNSVSARYCTLLIMSFSPLAFGNYWLYKVVPVVFFILFFWAITALLKAATETPRSKLQIYSASLVFTAVYLAVLPGLGEGIYWMSALISYQAGILLLITWFYIMTRAFRNKASAASRFLFCLIFLLVLGFNEPLAVAITGFTILMAIQRFRKGLSIFLPAVSLILSIPVWFLFIGADSFSHRYLPAVEAGISPVIKSFYFSLLLVGYHVGKCFLNPCIYIGLLLFIPSMLHLKIRKELMPSTSAAGTIQFFIVWGAIMILVAFLGHYFAPDRIVPLRISNMIVFIFLAGGLFLLRVHLTGKEAKAFRLLSGFVEGNRLYLVVLTLFVTAFFTRNNFGVGIREIASGLVQGYDREMKQRYRSIENCTTDTCEIPALKNRPVSIRFTMGDPNTHLSEYYNKSIIITDDLQ